MMMGAARWKSWTSFAAAVEPEMAKQEHFDMMRGRSPLLIELAIGHAIDTLGTQLSSTVIDVNEWVASETAVFRSVGKADEAHVRALRTAEASCHHVEESLLIAGDLPQLRRLLIGARNLRLAVKERCHHKAPGFATPLPRLASQFSSDFMKSRVDLLSKLDETLLIGRFPATVRLYFEEARDCLMLKHYELAALTAGRGLERACREVASRNALVLTISNRLPEPLADAELHDVIEALSRSRWADGTLVIDKPARALAQFVRQMRNVAGHASTSSVNAWQETSTLAAAAACRLLERSAETGQTITPTSIQKNWP